MRVTAPYADGMEIAELTTLLTPEGLRLLDTVGTVESTDDVARAVTRLRAAGHSPDLVAAVVGQARLRTRAVEKFGGFAERMLFTRAGLEQATRLSIAARHAARFRDAGLGTGESTSAGTGGGRIADLGCGIGGDALGLAGLGLSVLAVDADEVTAAIAAFNLTPFGDAVRVRHERAEDTDLTGIEAVWLDPARRSAGHGDTTRLRDPAEFLPPLDWVFDLTARLPGGVKLGPGLHRELIPADAEAQWITVGTTTIELVAWTGALARPGVRRAAVVARDDAWHELTAGGPAPDAPTRPLGDFVHEPAGSVIRAELIGTVAEALDAGMLADGIAYLTGDAAVTSPFVSSFRVRETLPFDTRKLAAALRARDIGTLEIKKRGVDVDPAQLRRSLRLRGDASATLLLTRVGGTRTAILADRT